MAWGSPIKNGSQSGFAALAALIPGSYQLNAVIGTKKAPGKRQGPEII